MNPPPRTQSQVVQAAIGFAMLAVSSPCVLAMLSDIFVTKTDNLSGSLIVGSFMGFVGIGGIVLMVMGFRRPKREPLHVDQALERQILAVGRSHGGRITVSELAVDTELTIVEASEALQHFERLGVVRTHLSDAGDIVYVFSDFTVNKASAVDPLDDEAVFDAALDAARDDEQDDAETVLAEPATAKNEDW